MTYSDVLSAIRFKTNTTESDLSILKGIDVFKASYLYKTYILKTRIIPSLFYQNFIIKLSDDDTREDYITKTAELPLKQLDGTDFKFFGKKKNYIKRADFLDAKNSLTFLNKTTPCFYADFDKNLKLYRIVFPSQKLVVDEIKVEGIFSNPFDISNLDNDTYPIGNELLDAYLNYTDKK